MVVMMAGRECMGLSWSIPEMMRYSSSGRVLGTGGIVVVLTLSINLIRLFALVSPWY